MSLFSKPKYSTVVVKKKDIPKGLYTKCPISGEVVFNQELEANQMVVAKSGYHFPIGAPARIKGLFDADTFKEFDNDVKSADPLKFVDSAAYPDRIKKYERESGLPEAVICGTGKIHGIKVSVAVMDFRFCGGAMGSAVGEKITRAIERAVAEKTPCIIFSASGG
ncbi:MAG: acetyl-CoA carboxylase carboxyl transferase subunit beta, partial [Burkholderiales bacterium]|nr:acetyl-CoA carboxylase carboxyl transferase subunit beta [Opitutaceae bacterium]